MRRSKYFKQGALVLVGLAGLFVVARLWSSFFSAPASKGLNFDEGLTEASVETVVDYVTKSDSKVILVNAWASWCGPCIDEIPLLLKLREAYRSDGFELLFFSADNKSDEDEVRQFLIEKNMVHSFFRGKNSQAGIELLYPNWSGALPVSVLYDSSRQIVKRWMGTASEAEFREAIEMALGLKEEIK